MGIVEGGTIPYKPDALKKKQDNFKNRMLVKVTNDPHRFDTGDPELQCFRPGVPRANYMPFPFPDFPEPRSDPDGLRIQGIHAHGLHGQASGRRRLTPGWDGRTAAGKATRWSST